MEQCEIEREKIYIIIMITANEKYHLRSLNSDDPPASSGMINNGNIPLSPITMDPNTEKIHGVYSNSNDLMYSSV